MNNSETQKVTSCEPLTSPPQHVSLPLLTFFHHFFCQLDEQVESFQMEVFPTGSNQVQLSKRQKVHDAKILSGWEFGFLYSNRSPSMPRWFAERMRKRRPRWTLRKQLKVILISDLLYCKPFLNFSAGPWFFSLFKDLKKKFWNFCIFFTKFQKIGFWWWLFVFGFVVFSDFLSFQLFVFSLRPSLDTGINPVV